MQDKLPHEVLHLLHMKGWSLRQLAFSKGYRSPSPLNRALYASAPKSEQIIADAIGVTRKDLWPSRNGEVGKLGRKMMRPSAVAA